MTEKVTWRQKYDTLVDSSALSIRQIQSVFTVGQPQAIDIRMQAIKLAKKYGRYISERKVPTDLVLEVMGLDYEYFRSMVRTEKNYEKEITEA